MEAPDFVRRPHLSDTFRVQAELDAVGDLLRFALHDGVVIQDSSARIVYFNPKATELLRMTDAELMGASSLDDRWQALTADGEPFPGEEHPAMRSLTAGERVKGEIMAVRRGDESLVWLSVDSYPLDLPSDRYAIAVFTDITQRISGALELRATREEIQRQLLQRDLPHSDRVRFSSAYRSTGASRSIGGDFLGAYRHEPDRFDCFIGDVCGHGVHAAGLSSVARHTVRAIGPLVDDPDQVLHRLHDVVQQDHPDLYVTALYAQLLVTDASSMTLRMACGGHPLPLLVRDGRAAPVGLTGSLVGMVQNTGRPVSEVALRPGDRVVLYTDGVLDGASPRLTTEELASVLPGEAQLDDLIDWMMTLGRVGRGGGAPDDDAAVLGLEIL